MDTLMDKGALDVGFIPVQMKKNRPGTRIEVLCKEADLDMMAKIIFRETTAIGLRYAPCDRMLLKRESVTIDTGDDATGPGLGRIQVKQITDPDGQTRLVPEFDDCKKKAQAMDLPLKEVYDRICAWTLDREQARLYKTDKGKD